MTELAGKCWVKKKVKFQTLVCQIYTIELGLVSRFQVNFCLKLKEVKFDSPEKIEVNSSFLSILLIYVCSTDNLPSRTKKPDKGFFCFF